MATLAWPCPFLPGVVWHLVPGGHGASAWPLLGPFWGLSGAMGPFL